MKITFVPEIVAEPEPAPVAPKARRSRAKPKAEPVAEPEIETVPEPVISAPEPEVVMEAAPAFWQSPEVLKDVFVIGPGGQQVPLSAFSRYEATSTPLAVNPDR